MSDFRNEHVEHDIAFWRSRSTGFVGGRPGTEADLGIAFPPLAGVFPDRPLTEIWISLHDYARGCDEGPDAARSGSPWWQDLICQGHWRAPEDPGCGKAVGCGKARFACRGEDGSQTRGENFAEGSASIARRSCAALCTTGACRTTATCRASATRRACAKGRSQGWVHAKGLIALKPGS